MGPNSCLYVHRIILVGPVLLHQRSLQPSLQVICDPVHWLRLPTSVVLFAGSGTFPLSIFVKWLSKASKRVHGKGQTVRFGVSHAWASVRISQIPTLFHKQHDGASYTCLKHYSARVCRWQQCQLAECHLPLLVAQCQQTSCCKCSRQGPHRKHSLFLQNHSDPSLPLLLHCCLGCAASTGNQQHLQSCSILRNAVAQ